MRCAVCVSDKGEVAVTALDVRSVRGVCVCVCVCVWKSAGDNVLVNGQIAEVQQMMTSQFTKKINELSDTIWAQ